MGEVDVQTHASVSLADTETTTIMMPPGDETKTTRALDVSAMFGEVDTQTHSNITSSLPPATKAAEVTTSTTLPKDD